MAQTNTAHKLITGPSGIGKTYALEQYVTKNGFLLNLADSQRVVVDKLASYCNAEIPNKTSLGEATAIVLENCKLISRPLILDNLDLASERTLKAFVIPLCQNAAHGVVASANISTPAKSRKIDIVRPFFRVEELKPLNRDDSEALLWKHCDKAKLGKRAGHVKKHILRTAGGVPGVIVAYAKRIENGGLAELKTIEPKTKHVNISLLVVFIVIVGLYVLRLNLPRENLGDQIIVGVLFAIMMLVRMLFTRSAKDMVE